MLIKHESFYDHKFETHAYDVIHFASSFMLLPNQARPPLPCRILNYSTKL